MGIQVVYTFWLLEIMLQKIFMYKFGVDISLSLGYMQRNGIVGSYSNFMFNHLSSFQSGCTILYFSQQCLRVPIFLYPH